MLETALRIALDAHTEQTDKAGQPYILHPLRLMMQMTTDEERAAALLHDVVEDSRWTFDMLRAEGISDNVLNAVMLLTHTPGTSYEEFIDTLKDHPLARRVKIADLEDNLNVFRLDELRQKDLERIGKYHRAWRLLQKKAET